MFCLSIGVGDERHPYQCPQDNTVPRGGREPEGLRSEHARNKAASESRDGCPSCRERVVAHWEQSGEEIPVTDLLQGNFTELGN